MDSVIVSFLQLLPHLEDIELCPLPAHSSYVSLPATLRLAPQLTHLALGFALPDQDDKIR